MMNLNRLAKAGLAAVLLFVAPTGEPGAKAAATSKRDASAQANLEDRSGTPRPADSQRSSALTRQDADIWLDGFLPYALKSGDIAGAVVVIVKDGEILTARGYGYADIAKRQPVDPQNTLFRPGSVTKLFTWTAVMQLVERGQIDLDADINQYLDFRIPKRSDGPITMRHLMTHRPGFEESLRGLITLPGVRKPGLGEDLKRWVPRRIFRAGSTPAYSNYGTGLAGYIVERVSGMPFEKYVEKNIFMPLSMAHSTLVQPVPAHFAGSVAKGYASASDKAQPFEMIANIPAGGLSATGSDMARFMIAHLDDGGQVLSPETTRLMHNSFTSTDPFSNRMALGFYEQKVNGVHAIAHGGDTQWFHSNLVLWPAQRVGLFVSVNSSGQAGAAGKLRELLLQQFVERYFRQAVLDRRMEDGKVAAKEAARVAGSYVFSRRSDSSFLRAGQIFSQFTVTAMPDGRLITPSSKAPGLSDEWLPVAAGLWKRSDGTETLAAIIRDNTVERIAIGSIAPIMLFDRVPASKNGALLSVLLGTSVVTLLLFLLGSALGRFFRWRYRLPSNLEGTDRRVRRAMIVVSTGVFASLTAWVVVILKMSGDLASLNGALDPLVRAAQFGSLLFMPALPVVAVWALWRSFKTREVAKIAAAALLFGAALVILWIAARYNFLSLALDY